jgi:serine/threonine protein phosphatase PrpC
MRQSANMIEFGHSTHVGLRREHNEDTYYADSDLGLWLVADGMGGHENGEVASALGARHPGARDQGRRGAVRAPSSSPTRRSSSTRIGARRPCRWAPRSRRCACKATTYEVAWVGDSRVYGVRRRRVSSQLSQDHSYVRELVEQGAISAEQARTHPHRNVVTQALGVTDPQSLRVETLTGDAGRLAASCCCAATG